MTDEYPSIDKKVGEESYSETRELTCRLQNLYKIKQEKFRRLASVTRKIDKKNEGVSQQTIDRIREGRTNRAQKDTIDLLNDAMDRINLPEYVTRDPIEEDRIAEHNRKLVESFANASKFNEHAENVCILFAELVGSTEFKRYHGVIEGMAKVLFHNMCVDEAIEQGRGITVKHLGDGVLGYFPGADAARKGISAGLDILRRIEEKNEREGWHNGDPNEICTRVGVHYGPAWMFQFKQSDRLDPQGPTVDLAARLCGIAGEMQVVITEETFVAAGGEERFPQHSDVQERYLKGILEKQRLLVVTINGKHVEPIPSPGYTPPLDAQSHRDLNEAEQPWVENGNFEESIDMYRELRRIDPRNFVASYRLAELLVWHYRGRPAEEHERLKEAREALCDTKHERPHCCYVWSLLSWIRYREFLLDTSDEAVLGDAVIYARTAISKAELNVDNFGAAVAKIYLIIYLNKQIEYEYGDVSSDLALAQRYVSEVQKTFDNDSRNQSNFDVGKALTFIAAGQPEKTEELLNAALKANPGNRLVFEARMRLAELAIGTEPFGGE